ncbi:MAG: hypothetical protein R3C26_06975 [Calditrichia bacterium]
MSKTFFGQTFAPVLLTVTIKHTESPSAANQVVSLPLTVKLSVRILVVTPNVVSRSIVIVSTKKSLALLLSQATKTVVRLEISVTVSESAGFTVAS